MSIEKGLPAGFNPDAYDALVVGAGYAGATCARRFAESCGFKVCVLERRDHIAGNAYDYVDEAGILIHKYGPHIYHTVNDRVNDFLSRFTEWTDYQHKVLANIHGTLMPVPFNHRSLKLAFGEEKGERLYQKLVDTFGENKKVPIMELREKNDPELVEVADYVYENVFLYYTMKQWGQTPDQIDPSITGRVPVFVGDDDRYFPQAPHQGMPAEGYTALFEHMFAHDCIDVFLDVDARDLLKVSETGVTVCDRPYGGEIIYTGPLDELFGLDLGALPYRTLDMEFETLDQDQFQPVGTVNYTTSEDFTRITEFKNMTGQVVPGKTTIMREYSKAYTPGSGETPYYAILEDENLELYRRYRARVEDLVNFHCVGRLAEYRYAWWPPPSISPTRSSPSTASPGRSGSVPRGRKDRMKKIITFGIPCYNSAEYMDHCIESILEGTGYAEDVEIVIVDDGSTKDDTPAKADAWAERHPTIIKAVHQENGGHGAAVMQAVRNATGVYFKNVDSDDWVDASAVSALLAQLRRFDELGEHVDLVITNYVYEHVEDDTRNVVDYRHVLPVGRIFTWNDMGHFMMWQYLLMHALTYRVDVLREVGLEMPPHTFYVDNIYAYVPFPACRSIYYLDVDVYRYFIGREDQSVNDKVLTSRVDHYWRVARVMMHAYHVYDDISSAKLRSYMMNYFTIIMAICSVFSKKSDRPDAMDELQKLWDELRAYDKRMYRRARHGIVGMATNLPGTVGRALTLAGYRAAQKLVKFN